MRCDMTEVCTLYCGSLEKGHSHNLGVHGRLLTQWSVRAEDAPSILYILLNFNWTSVNKTKIPLVSSMCMFYLKASKNRKKWQSLMNHYKAFLFPCSFTPLSKSLQLYGGVPHLQGWGGVDKELLDLESAGKETLQLYKGLWARWRDPSCLFLL